MQILLKVTQSRSETVTEQVQKVLKIYRLDEQKKLQIRQHI